MKIATKALAILLSLCLSTLTGCGLIQFKLIDNDKFKDIPTFDPNDYNCSIDYQTVPLDNGNFEIKVQVNDKPIIETSQTRPIRFKYPMLSFSPTTKCKINNNSYPIIFDTGNPNHTQITADHILENHLPIYPVNFTDPNGNRWDLPLGTAMIEELKIEELTIKNLPAQYRHYHTGYTLLGLDFLEFGKRNNINIPLPIMRKFKYITFNDIKNHMEFSLNDSFKPDDLNKWRSYPLMTKNKRIYIESTLEGVPVKLMIDTGCTSELYLTKECFDAMANNQPKLEKAWKIKSKGFAPYAGGYHSNDNYIVFGLKFDSRKYKYTSIITTIDKGVMYDSLIKEEFDGMIGFSFFDDTIMTLDFEHDKMWVKKIKRTRFEQ